MKTSPLAASALAILFSLLSWPLAGLGQGSLTPPGPPQPTMRTLDQVEARGMISFVPTNITVPGSYYLTGNLTGVASADGITITANDVTIDLNGFALTGAASSGVAINVSGVHTNITVRNGSIVQWVVWGVNGNSIFSGPTTVALHVEHVSFARCRSGAIQAGDGAMIQDCDISYSPATAVSSAAINAGSSSVIRNCSVRNSATDGIVTGYGSLISHCNVSSSGAYGYKAGTANIVEQCTAVGCVSVGISAAQGSTLTECTAYSNGGSGISSGNGSTIKGCTAFQNIGPGIVGFDNTTIVNCTVRGNRGSGIDAGGQSLVTGCLATGNTNYGIVVTAEATISHSQASRNLRNGIQAGSEATLIGNAATYNAWNGIVASTNCLVKDCLAGHNATNGIMVDTQSFVAGNNCANNDNGGGVCVNGTDSRIENNNSINNPVGYKMLGSNNFFVKNKASSNTTNYQLPVAEAMGVVLTTTGAVLTNALPFANFGY